MNIKLLFVLMPMLLVATGAKNQTISTDSSTAEPVTLKGLVETTTEVKQSSEELKKDAQTITPKPKVVYRNRTKYRTEFKEVPPESFVYLLTLNGQQYEVEPMYYKGYASFNVDSVQQEIQRQEFEEMPVLLDTVVEEYAAQRNVLQQAIDFIRKPFRKNKNQ